MDRGSSRVPGGVNASADGDRAVEPGEHPFGAEGPQALQRAGRAPAEGRHPGQRHAGGDGAHGGVLGQPGEPPGEGAGEYDLLVSPRADRSGAVPLAGATVNGQIRVFTGPDDGVTAVSFWIDDPGRTRSPYRTEGTAPFDLAGGSAASATGYDPRKLADGEHTVTAALTLAAG